MYIDCVVIKGEDSKGFSCSSQVTDNNGATFAPLDLNGYSVLFQILGAPTADAKVLVEHLITQNTDLFSEGQINNPEVGEFTFVITKEDTDIIGLGNHPIRLVLVNADDLTPELTLTEGGLNGEFSKVQVVQV